MFQGKNTLTRQGTRGYAGLKPVERVLSLLAHALGNLNCAAARFEDAKRSETAFWTSAITI